MAIFDKYLVNSFLRSETTTEPIPTAFYSENFATTLGDFTTSGDAVWTRVIDEGNGDLFSAKSGAITDKQASILTLIKTTTQFSTLLKYDYKTSTEADYDFLLVIVNDVIVKRYSGTNAWTSDSVFVHGIGSQTIKFVYWKDNSSDGGSLDTVWLDNVSLHNYEESGISNTSTLFKEDVTVDGDFVVKNGEAGFSEINLTGRFNAFNSVNKRFLAIRPAATGGNISMWNDAGVFGYTQSLSSTSMGVSLKNPTTGADKVVFGANTAIPEGFLQLPSTGGQLRLGEFAGSDVTKILVVNGESAFRDAVGIGEYSTLPQAKLHVTDYTEGTNNVAVFKGKAVVTEEFTSISIHNGYSAEYRKEVRIGAVAETSSSNITAMALYTSPNAAGSDGHERMRITGGGNVGIGTTSPAKNLEVRGVSRWGNGSTSIGDLSYGIAGGLITIEAASVNTDIALLPSGTGNVGIGTTSPLAKLEASGVSDTSIRINSTKNDASWVVNTTTIGALEFYGNDESGGGAGVKSAIRAVATQIQGHAFDLTFSTSDNTTNDVEAMRIDEFGNVGIGVTDPSAKLEVFGDIYISKNDGEALTLGNSNYATKYITVREGANYANKWGLQANANIDGNGTGLMISSKPLAFKAGVSSATAFADVTAPHLKINTDGTIDMSSTVTATNFILSSDERLKENIQKFDYGQHIKMDVKTYDLKSEKGVKRIGVIAQELEVNHPEFVRTDNKGMKSVAYIDLLMAKIAELEARLEKAGI
jgi:hypothetical protein